MIRFTRRFWFISALMLPCIFAASFWEKKDFTEWNDKQVRRMLTNSPWAREVTVALPQGFASAVPEGGRADEKGRFGTSGASQGPSSRDSVGPRGGQFDPGFAGELSETTMVTVRWLSSLPIKQAFVKHQFGDEATTAEEAQKILSQAETHYVVAIGGLPPWMAQMGQPHPETLKKDVLLKRKKKPNIPAEQMDAHGDGREAELIFLFPRGDEITLDDENVEVAVKLGGTNIKRKFNLKNMVYNGKLEL
jgi:hypothetical protein